MSIVRSPARVLLAALLLAAALTPRVVQAQSANPGNKEIRWVRDSEEYATIFRATYRAATHAAEAAARAAPRGQSWAVVLDIDETTLDNSVYQLDRAAYGLAFDTVSWNAWMLRREAGVVPGVQDFIAAVRRLGGRVAWITNRGEMARAATRENLARFGLWNDADRLCVITADAAYTKAARRAEMMNGTGACAWEGQRTQVVAYVGDSLGDFPAAGEGDADAGSDALFGVRYFLLPDPMYGSWERRPTRRW